MTAMVDHLRGDWLVLFHSVWRGCRHLASKKSEYKINEEKEKEKEEEEEEEEEVA